MDTTGRRDLQGDDATGPHHAAGADPAATAPVTAVPLGLLIEPRDAHRDEIEPSELDALTDSIRTQGVLVPIIVRPVGDRYEIIAGHRRYLASRRLGRYEIPAIIREDCDETETHRIRAAENLMRVQLTPLEESRITTTLRDATGYDVDELAHHLNRSRYWVETRLALGEITPELRELVHLGDLSIGHALLLATVRNPAQRAELTHHAATSGATLAVVRRWVDDYKQAEASGIEAPQIEYERSPETGQIIVYVRCVGCSEPTPYPQTTLIRVCAGCATVIRDNGAAQ